MIEGESNECAKVGSFKNIPTIAARLASNGFAGNTAKNPREESLTRSVFREIPVV